MEVADHCVAPPLHHKADYVQIHLGYEDRHGPFCEEVEGADVGSHEPDEWACCPDNSLDGGGDIGTVDLCPCPDVLDTFNGGVTGGTVASKMYHTAMYLCHWTPYGKAGAAVPNKFTINVIFLRGKYQAEKVRWGEGFTGRGDVLCQHHLCSILLGV